MGWGCSGGERVSPQTHLPSVFADDTGTLRLRGLVEACSTGTEGTRGCPYDIARGYTRQGPSVLGAALRHPSAVRRD